MNSASIIIPTYNENQGLSTILKKIENFLNENKNFDCEFIFVDDGSDQPIEQHINKSDRIKVVRNNNNSGYGFSIKKAVKESRYELIGIIDADDSYDFDFLIANIKNFSNEIDLLVGKRKFNFDEGLLRKTYRSFLNKFSSILCNFKIQDINSGIRLFKKDFFLKNINYFPDKFSITSTQTLIYIMNNKKIKYIETSYSKRSGKSKINIFKDPFNFIFLILKIYMLFAPLKFFTWTGLIFILMAFLIGILTLFFFFSIADVTVLLLFLTGVNCILIGLLAETIRLKK